MSASDQDSQPKIQVEGNKVVVSAGVAMPLKEVASILESGGVISPDYAARHESGLSDQKMHAMAVSTAQDLVSLGVRQNNSTTMSVAPVYSSESKNVPSNARSGG